MESGNDDQHEMRWIIALDYHDDGCDLARALIMTARRRVISEFTIGYGLKALGWAATLAMVACVVGMVVTALVWGLVRQLRDP